MKSILTTLGLVASLISLTPTAEAEEMQEAAIRSHPSQGKVTHIINAKARLMADGNGVFTNMETTGLLPGHIYTMWMVVINDPAACPALPCTPKDVLKRSDAVQSDVGFAGGAIANAKGEIRLSFYKAKGPFLKPFFSHGLKETSGIEIHLILNEHGPVISGREFEMLNTYRGGCTDKSIPKAMPDTARAMGEPGPYQCRMVQFAQFLPT